MLLQSSPFSTLLLEDPFMFDTLQYMLASRNHLPYPIIQLWGARLSLALALHRFGYYRRPSDLEALPYLAWDAEGPEVYFRAPSPPGHRWL